jgi:translation elongation factor EF-1beta
VFAGLIALAASACRPNETVERQSKDASIKTSIKAKLASDVRFSTLTAVSVDVTNGIVTLAGPVHSEDEKARIEETVRSVEGVVSINDNLQVEPASGAAPPSGAPPVIVVTAPPGAMAPTEVPTPLPYSATPPAPLTPPV